MSTNGWPNFNAWLDTAWGAGGEFWTSAWCGLGPVGFVFGTNPPYYLNDFLNFFPKFFGLPTLIANAGLTQGSSTVALPSTTGLQYGQFLTGAGVDLGTVITAVSVSTITLSKPATATGSNVVLQVYENPPVPMFVIQLYINLANSSLVQARWQESWLVGMGWFVAHYLTLYAKSDASTILSSSQVTLHGETPTGAIPGTAYTLSSVPPSGVLQSLTQNGLFLIQGVNYTLSGANITLAVATSAGDNLYVEWALQTPGYTSTSAVPGSSASIAIQGLAGGIQVSKAVGDVSVSYQPLVSLEDWGAWNLTSYGQQLATMAAVIGAGPALIW